MVFGGFVTGNAGSLESEVRRDKVRAARGRVGLGGPLAYARGSACGRQRGLSFYETKCWGRRKGVFCETNSGRRSGFSQPLAVAGLNSRDLVVSHRLAISG